VREKEKERGHTKKEEKADKRKCDTSSTLNCYLLSLSFFLFLPCRREGLGVDVGAIIPVGNENLLREIVSERELKVRSDETL
jgi:hypothetical protein